MYERETFDRNWKSMMKENDFKKILAHEDEFNGVLHEKIAKEGFLDQKMRQKIRENSQELRLLERQLKAAYVNKELAAQLAEKEAERIAKRYHEELEKVGLRIKCLEEENCKKELRKLEMDRKGQYLQDLLKQVKHEEEKSAEAYKEFIQEKMLIDKAVLLMHEEDKRELEELMIKKKKTKDELDAFRKSQDKWKEIRKFSMEEENRRIAEYLKNKEESNSQMVEVIKDRERQKAAIREGLMDILEEHERQQVEQRGVLEKLHEEEMLAREEERVRIQLKERLSKRHEIKVAEAFSRQERLRKLEEENLNEAKERLKVLEEMARKAKLEQLGLENERRKRLEHRRAVEELLKERRKLREEEIAEIQRLQIISEKEQEEYWRVIEEERLNMLREHASKLIGFLPPGLVKDDDLPVLGIQLSNKTSEEP